MGFFIAILIALISNSTKIVDPTGGNLTSSNTTLNSKIVDPTGGNLTSSNTTLNSKIVDPTGGN